MKISGEWKLGELATRVPGTIPVLNAYHLDFCCGGERTIREACAETGIETEPVLLALKQATEEAAGTSGEAKWEDASVTDLVRHAIDVYHTFTRDTLERVTMLIGKVTLRHGASHPELRAIDAAFAELRSELVEHMAKEERVLFPYAVALDRAVNGRRNAPPVPGFRSIRNPVSAMEKEHQATGAVLRTIRHAASDFVPPPDACESYRALFAALAELESDLKLHIAFESSLLYPKAVELEDELHARPVAH